MLTEEDWEAFSRDGFLRLGQVLDEDEVRALQARADALALEQLTTPAVEGLEADDLFGPLVRKPIFREVCARTYGPHAGISVFRATVRNEPAEQGTHRPWHQDGGAAWQLDRDPLVTIWVALDAATEPDGCLEAVRGSHRLGLIDVHRSTLSEASARRHCPSERIVPLEAPSGHAIALHSWAIRRSATRRAFTACFLDARTRGLLTGEQYQVVHGEASREPAPFVRQLQEECAAHARSAVEAERYAVSLRSAHDALQASLDEATRRATSLQAEVTKLDPHRHEVGDLREENRRLRAATAQMRAELLALHRRLDAEPPSESAPATPGPTLRDWQVMTEDIQRLNAHAIDLARRLNATHASRSWLLTRPVRDLAHALRRLRGGSGEPGA